VTQVNKGKTSEWTPKDEARFREALAMAEEARQRVEAHDPQTHEHAVRVARWALLMAQRLPSFDQRRLRRLEISALLHDYGKLMVPKAVLNKPGPLDPHEWELIKMHPVVGAMMAPVSEDFVNKDAIMWHHKTFNGKGYPDGDLSGYKIPVEARITSVADIFDAVVSNRSYHPKGTGIPPSQAVDLLHQLAGSALDPTLVMLFENAMDEASPLTRNGVGFRTLAIASVIHSEVARATNLLGAEIGDFDPKDPFGKGGAPPGLEDKLVRKIVRATVDERSARNLVRHVMRLPLQETFARPDILMTDEELKSATRRICNHEEAMLFVRKDAIRLSYQSVAVFMGMLWLCVGEEVGDKTRVMLIR
jgi:hypothetical protein